MDQREAEALSEAECRRPVPTLNRPAFWSLLLMVPALCLAGCGESQGDEEKVSGTSGISTSTVPPNAGDFVTDKCWSKHQAMPGDAQADPSPKHCAAFNAMMCTWEQAGSKEKMCFPKICVAKHLEKEIADKGQSPVKDFMCHELHSSKAHEPTDKTSPSKDTQITTSTSKVPPNAGDFVTDKCWSQHLSMPSDAQADPSPKHCAAFHARMCTWEQAGSKQKMCFPKICVAKHLEKEIADKGRAEVKDFMCYELKDNKGHFKG